MFIAAIGAASLVSLFLGMGLGWLAGQDKMASEVIWVLRDIEIEPSKRQQFLRRLIDLREARIQIPKADLSERQ